MFPVTTYANVAVVDVTRRVVMPQSVLRQPTAFSPYTVVDGQREDLVSYLYYGSEDDDWLISIANQIVDPYYGWFLDDDEFAAYVIMKYGDLPTAMGRVHHWTTNWASDFRRIQPGYYEALTDNLRKYWVPVYGQGANVLSYQRRPEDWTQATNSLMGVTPSSPAPFQIGDLLAVYDPGGNLQGTGEVAYVSEGGLTAKDVQGNWAQGYTLTGTAGSVTVSALGTRTDLISIDEVPYWTSVSCYDFEYDANQALKEILLVQDSYKPTMYTEMQAALTDTPAP